jgi:hypothetical protein
MKKLDKCKLGNELVMEVLCCREWARWSLKEKDGVRRVEIEKFDFHSQRFGDVIELL